ncbi:MAG: hypothetical protein QN120_05115 [Armatimonadota bacterium]|nr:hypothetical protein [Armatimonadota bacterium]
MSAPMCLAFIADRFFAVLESDGTVRKAYRLRRRAEIRIYITGGR